MTKLPTRKTSKDMIDELSKKRSQIDARIQKHQARLRGEQRKQDTRRKIIAGAIALEHAAIDPQFGNTLRRLLAEHVTRDADRKLFEL